MTTIGLIGESPNDTKAIRNLLAPAYNGKVRFKLLLKNLNGCTLDSDKFTRMLFAELKTNRNDIYVFIRDADSLATETETLEKRRKWYREHSKGMRQSLLLLNIYELEALIFADIDTFNRIYGSSIHFSGDVTMKPKPKKELMHKTDRPKKYEESHCPHIFAQLRLATVRQRCAYFAEFVTKLNEVMNAV